MTAICLIMISVGTLIMAISIIYYYDTLLFMKKQHYDKRVFNNRIYLASIIMMVFFMLGYISVGIIVLSSKFQYNYLLISIIFFFGAVFVFCMVQVQKTMAKTIISKTLETIQSMINVIEAKDIYTKGHSLHVHNLVVLIYDHMPLGIKRTINLTNLKDAAILHDIGKISIPDTILNKPGKLTPEEYEIIKQHPKNGKTILENTCFADISTWILYHHERMDGKGYYGITGAAIPIESKIIALADIFSALYTDRVYRKKYSYETCIEILRESSGTHLDAYLVDIFTTISIDEINSATPTEYFNKKSQLSHVTST